MNYIDINKLDFSKNDTAILETKNCTVTIIKQHQYIFSIKVVRNNDNMILINAPNCYIEHTDRIINCDLNRVIELWDHIINEYTHSDLDVSFGYGQMGYKSFFNKLVEKNKNIEDFILAKQVTAPDDETWEDKTIIASEGNFFVIPNFCDWDYQDRDVMDGWI